MEPQYAQQGIYYVLQPARQPESPIGERFGACDPANYAVYSAVQPFRFALVAVAFTAAAAGGDLIAASGTSVSAFTVGRGQSLTDAGLWGNATYADTDAYTDGALVDEGMEFKIRGVAIQPEKPFTKDGTDRRRYSGWLEPYAPSLVQAALSGVFMEANFGNSNISYGLGVPSAWPQMAGALGGGAVANGTPMAGIYLPFQAPIKAGAKGESNKFSLDVTVGQALNVENLTLSPTAATTVYVPLRIFLLGNSQPSAANPGVAAELAATRRRLAELEARMGVR